MPVYNVGASCFFFYSITRVAKVPNGRKNLKKDVRAFFI